MTKRKTEKLKLEITCVECKKVFVTNCRHQITCSEKCRKEKNLRVQGRKAFINDGLPSGTVGALGELFVAGFFLEKGFSVFRAVSQSCFCDLIIIKNKKLYKVEVRVGYKNTETGIVLFSRAIRGEIDMFAVYERNSKEVILFEKDTKTVINHNKLK